MIADYAAGRLDGHEARAIEIAAMNDSAIASAIAAARSNVDRVRKELRQKFNFSPKSDGRATTHDVALEEHR